MITLFSIPKSFKGHIGVIQTNAIRSWTRLPGCEVILFGEEEGLAAAAATLGVRHVPKIGCNESGTPLVGDAFAQARCLATQPLLAYVNADIVLLGDFLRAAEIAERSNLETWLMVGQRRDIDIFEPLAFVSGWEERLIAEVKQRGVLHGKSGIDYFLFPRNFPVKLPSFAVGRPGWDTWLIYQTRALSIPLIDATNEIVAVHQNHPPAYQPYGHEANHNRRLAGGYYRMSTLRDADWRLTPAGITRFPLIRRIAGKALFSPLGRMLLALRRGIVSRASHAL